MCPLHRHVAGCPLLSTYCFLLCMYDTVLTFPKSSKGHLEEQKAHAHFFLLPKADVSPVIDKAVRPRAQLRPLLKKKINHVGRRGGWG